MPTEHSTRAHRSGYGTIVLPKERTSAPAPHPKVVSASAIFKKPAVPQKVPRVQNVQKVLKTVGFTPEVITSVGRLSANASSERSISPLKSGWSDRKRRAASHPLAMEFKNSADNYRAHLYTTSTAKLDKTYNALIDELHNFNLVDLSSPSTTEDADESPIRLTISAKFDREWQKLFNPIGDYTISTTSSNGNDKIEQTVSLRDKLAIFSETYQNDIKALLTMQKQWEGIVGELWKTGISCLGEETMTQLFVVSPTHSSPAKLDEDSLFVPEPSPGPQNGKKRVTFQEPLPELPAFFLGQLRMKPLPQVPELTKDRVKSLDSAVNDLGRDELAELKQIDQDNKNLWNKKMGNVVKAMQDDN